MRKIVLVALLSITLTNLIILILALTNEKSMFYGYRLVIGIMFIMFGGFLTRYLLSYNKKTSEN
jgi:hypothetical protein